MIAEKWKIFVAAILFCLLFSGFTAAQTVFRKSSSRRIKQPDCQSSEKNSKYRKLKRSGRTAQTAVRRKAKTIISKKSVKNSRQTIPAADKTGGLEKAGEFNGDLRDLPSTKPADQEHRRPGEPPGKPIAAPTPTIKPPQ